MHSLVFEAPRGLAPKAEQLARIGPERLPEGLNSCPLAGEQNEKVARCGKTEGPRGGSLQRGAPESVQALLSALRPPLPPATQKPSPQRRLAAEGGPAGEGKGEGASTMGAGRGWRGGGPGDQAARSRRSCSNALRKNAEEGNPFCPRHQVSPVTSGKVLPQKR